MTARRPFYNAEETLQRIWNDSGDEEDILDSDESEAESYASLNEDQNNNSHHGSSSNEWVPVTVEGKIRLQAIHPTKES